MKRLTWIDVAKGLGILLVVLAHTRFPTKEMSWWINSFHMPLFFVIAGLCYDESRYPSLLTYLKRKCVALAYPYFTKRTAGQRPRFPFRKKDAISPSP